MGTATAPVKGSGSCPEWMARVAKPGCLFFFMHPLKAPAVLFFASFAVFLADLAVKGFLPHAAQHPPSTYIPPSKTFFDKYRSAESGIIVTTRFPAPSRRATTSAAYTAAPPLDPDNTPS